MRNAQTEWARCLVDGLVSAGLRQAVVSPGSRSTPVVCALVERREVTITSIIDERAAAFFALGQARATLLPTLLVCTSGTAGAHYFPAVIEATASGIPLLALTADRPADWTHSGANQTIDQRRLFGHHAVGSFELPIANGRRETLVAVRRLAVQAYSRSLSRTGAVQINAPADKPLEPLEAESEAEERFAQQSAKLRAQPAPAYLQPLIEPSFEALDHVSAELQSAVQSTGKGLIVCGPASIDNQHVLGPLLQLSGRLGFPVLAEATSQLRYRKRPPHRFVDLFPLLVGGRKNRRALAPDFVVQLGEGPIAADWLRLLGEHPPEKHWILGAKQWGDPSNTATYHLPGRMRSILTGVVDRLPNDDFAEGSWSQEWLERSQQAQEAVEHWFIDQHPGTGEESLRQGHVCRSLINALPNGSALALGNSLPVRDLDVYQAGGNKELTLFHQRGVSGIDGLLAGALGAASQGSNLMALLIGDVSLAHDLGSLTLLAELPRPVVVIVIDNQGGRIFDHLPITQGAVSEAHLDHWRTPPKVDFSAVAKSLGINSASVSNVPALDRAIDQAVQRAGKGLSSLVQAQVAAESAMDSRHLADQLDHSR